MFRQRRTPAQEDKVCKKLCLHQIGYFDIELIDESGEVVESVEYISACKLSEIIDQLVEVTENYSDDIVRWLRKCTPNENQTQKIGRMAKVCPEVAAEIKLKTLFSKR